MLRRALVTRLGAARRLLQQAPSAPAPSASHLAPLSPPSTSALLLGASHTSAASQLAGGAGQEDATNRAGDATGAVASAADAGAFAPAATPGAATGGERIEKAAGMAPAELTAEDYQQLTPEEFAAVADLYLGGLWTRIERGLREAEGEEFDYNVRPERGALLVLLPYDGQLVIRKDPQQRRLLVENNLFEPYEDRDHAEFRPCGENCWADEDELGLTDFISEALSRYLKAEVKV